MEGSYFSSGQISQNFNSRPKKSVSVSTLIISIITSIVLVLLIVLKWQGIVSFLGFEQTEPEAVYYHDLYVGDFVSFSGTIKNDGDMVNYTHTYYSEKHGKIGLKSVKFNLNDYTDDVEIEGLVDKIYHDVPIVLVNRIFSLNLDEDIQENTGDLAEVETGESKQKYLPSLGLYFDSSFFEKYSIINEGDGKTFSLKNLETNVVSDISYFKCNPSKSDQNCKSLNDVFSDSASKKLVDRYGVSYYKQSEVNSWFFSNDSLFGYWVNDGQDSFVQDISSLITVVNADYVKKNILPNITKLCTAGSVSMQNIVDSKPSYRDNNLYYTIDGNDGEGSNISCEILVDPTLKFMAKVVDIKIDEKKGGQTLESESTGNDSLQTDGKKDDVVYNRDENVEQFPIKPEKSLTFNSSRGHSFVFPSSNLSYKGVNAQEDFDQVGVNCFSAMNIVQYSNSGLVETDPSVVVYECTVKKTFDDSDKSLIYRPVGERHFVIKIIDPAWVNFANHIEISVK